MERIYEETNSGKIIPKGELVRCKDCKYGERMCQPWNDIVCTENNAIHIPVWYCADGERR